MKKLYVFFVLAVIMFVAGNYYIYKTDYTSQYKDFLIDITDVKNKEYITNVKMHAPTKYPGKTKFDIYIKDDFFTEDQILQMTKDIAKNIDDLAPNVEKTLPFDHYRINLFISIMGDDSNIPIYSVHGSKDVYEYKENGVIKSKWTFSIGNDEESTIVDEIYVETKYLNEP